MNYRIHPIPSPIPKIPEKLSQAQKSSKKVSAAYPLVNTSGSKKRFPTDQVKKQSEFWELSHQTISKTTKYCNLTVKELKEEASSMLNSIMPSKKGIRSPLSKKKAIIDLINGSKTKHEVLIILLSLERSMIDKHFEKEDDSYKDFLLVGTEAQITTCITEENYGIEYSKKFKRIGEDYFKKLNDGTKTETEFFFIRPKTSVEVEAPELYVSAKLSRCLKDDDFNNKISKLTEPLSQEISRESKLKIIGELYHDSYFSMPAGRGAAHNSLMLMYSLYSIAFEESLPPLKEGVMLDLELFNNIDQKESKKIFLENFKKMKFFEDANMPQPPPITSQPPPIMPPVSLTE